MKANMHRSCSSGPLNGSPGFSLVEMMISITIGMVLIAGLIGVLVSSSRSAQTNDKTAELQSNGRYALNLLRQELRHADFRGYTWAAPTPPTTAITITNECLAAGQAAGDFVSNLGQGVWGANDVNPYAGNCLSGLYVRGDVLVIRHAAQAALVSPITLVNGNIYFRSAFTKGEMFKAPASAVAATGSPQNANGTAFGADQGEPLADFLVQEQVYYIGNDDANASVPALRRRALNGSDMTDEMVVSGIEQIQVKYGRAIEGNTRYFDADEISAEVDPAAAWEGVNSVRIWVLARNSRVEPGYSSARTYSMGDLAYAVNDGFRRQVFTSVVQLRNFHTN